MQMHDHPQRNGWFTSRPTTWILLGIIIVGTVYLVTAHTAHVLPLLPFAIFLLCPLMMLFMHGHGGHGGHNEHQRPHQEPPQAIDERLPKE